MHVVSHFTAITFIAFEVCLIRSSHQDKEAATVTHCPSHAKPACERLEVTGNLYFIFVLLFVIYIYRLTLLMYKCS